VPVTMQRGIGGSFTQLDCFFAVVAGESAVIQSPQELLERAMELTSSDRGRLAAMLIESLETHCEDDDTTEAWSEEVQRRLRDIDDGKISLVPWAEVRRRMSDKQ
jgi:putative addiction module component (TIGR02574 family)